MAKPDTLAVDRHAFSWQRLGELRREFALQSLELGGRTPRRRAI
jgi:hypothetical protein